MASTLMHGSNNSGARFGEARAETAHIRSSEYGVPTAKQRGYKTWSNPSGNKYSSEEREDWEAQKAARAESKKAARQADTQSATSTSPDVGAETSQSALDTDTDTATRTESVKDKANAVVAQAKANGPLTLSFDDEGDEDRRKAREADEANGGFNRYDSQESKGYNKLHGIDADTGTVAHKATEPKQSLSESGDYANIGLEAKGNVDLTSSKETKFDAARMEKDNEEAANVIRRNEEKRQEYEKQVEAANKEKARLEAAPKATEEESRPKKASDLTETVSNISSSKDISDPIRQAAEEHQLPELTPAADSIDKYFDSGLVVGRRGDTENALVTDDGMPSDNFLRANGLVVDDTDPATMKAVAAVARGEMPIEEATKQIKLRYEGGDPSAGLRVFLNTGIVTEGFTAGTRATSTADLEQKERQILMMKSNFMKQGLSGIDATNAVIDYFKSSKAQKSKNAGNDVGYDLSSWGNNRQLAEAGVMALSMALPGVSAGLNSTVLNSLKHAANATQRGGALRTALGAIGLTNINGTVTVGRISNVAVGALNALSAVGTAAGAVAAANDIASSASAKPQTSTPVEANVTMPTEPEYEPVPEVDENKYRVETETGNINVSEDLINRLNNITERNSDLDLVDTNTDIAQLSSLVPGSDEWNDGANKLEKDLSKSVGALLDKKDTQSAQDAYELASIALSAMGRAQSDVNDYENKVFGEDALARANDILANPRLYTSKEVMSAQAIVDRTSDQAGEDAVMKAASNGKMEQAINQISTLTVIAAARTGDNATFEEAMRNASAYTGRSDNEVFDAASSLNIEMPKPAFRSVSLIKGLGAKVADAWNSTSLAQGIGTVKTWLSNAKDSIKSFFSKLTPDASSFVGKMSSNVKKFLGNLFSPIKAADAALKTSSDVVSGIMDLITKPFDQLNKKVSDFNDKLEHWHDMGVAVVEGKVKDMSDTDSMMSAVNTARGRAWVFGLTELAMSMIEAPVNPYVAMGTATNAFLKIYKGVRDLDQESIDTMQGILNDMYGYATQANHEDHNYIQKQSLSSLSKAASLADEADDISSTLNSADDTGLNAEDVERDYSGWNLNIGDLYSQNPSLGASFVSSLA